MKRTQVGVRLDKQKLPSVVASVLVGSTGHLQRFGREDVILVHQLRKAPVRQIDFNCFAPPLAMRQFFLAPTTERELMHPLPAEFGREPRAHERVVPVIVGGCQHVGDIPHVQTFIA